MVVFFGGLLIAVSEVLEALEIISYNQINYVDNKYKTVNKEEKASDVEVGDVENLINDIENDIKDNRVIIVTGENLPDCLAKASVDLCCLVGDMDYEIINSGDHGILGIGAIDTKIKAWRRKAHNY